MSLRELPKTERLWERVGRLVEHSTTENGVDETERMVKTVRVEANRSSAGPFEAPRSVEDWLLAEQQLEEEEGFALPSFGPP